MRLSKKLIVTGLLFSSVLGSVNLGAVSAMAAVDQNQPTEVKPSESSEVKDLKILYTDEHGDPITDEQFINEAKKSISVAKIDKKLKLERINLPKGYAFVENKDVDIYDNNVSIRVKKIDNSQNHLKVKVKVIFVNGKDEVASTDTAELNEDGTVNEASLPKDKRAHHRIKAGVKHVVTLDEAGNKIIKVEVEKTKNINIKYIFDGKEKVIADNQPLEVLENAKNIDIKDIKKAEGYSIALNQKFAINPTNNTVEVKLAKTIALTYIDANGFKITDSNLPATVGIEKDSNKLDLKNIKLPAGYKFVDNKPVDIANGKATVKISRAKIVNIKVVYVDKDTKKAVSSHKLSGTTGAAHKLDVPKGYKVVEGSSNVVTFDKDGAVVNVVVEKVTPITNHKTTITTYPGSFVSLYNQKGEFIQNRGLGANSSWASDKTMMLNGVKYYRVSTNEWVKAESVYEYTGLNNTVITTTKGKYKSLYTTRGKAVGNRGLGANSSWITDKAATINGEKMYRVATNEWIKASDIK